MPLLLAAPKLTDVVPEPTFCDIATVSGVQPKPYEIADSKRDFPDELQEKPNWA